MTAPVIASERRSTLSAWIYHHLVMRRSLSLAVLVLVASLLTLSIVIHPMPPTGQGYQRTVPFVTAYGGGIDYYQFWVVGRVTKHLRLANIYSTEDRLRLAEAGRTLLISSTQPSERVVGVVQVRGQTIQTFSTPFLYAVLSVFGNGQYEGDYAFFQDTCLAATILSVVAMGWILHYSLTDSLLFIAMMLLWSEPLASDFRVGNVNQLQLLGVAIYLLLRSRSGNHRLEILSGLLMGLLVAFKPTLGVIPLLLTVAWVIDGRWSTLLRQGAAAVAAAGVAFMVGCVFLNSWSAWFDWMHALSDLENISDVSVLNGNYSLAQAIHEATSETQSKSGSLSMILLGAVLVLTGIALMMTRPGTLNAEDGRRVRSERDFLVTSLGCALSVVTLKLAWVHYYVLLIPLLLYVLRPGGWVIFKGAAPGQPGLLWPIAGLALALFAFLSALGWPLAFVFDPSPSSHIAQYIVGAWGLMALGVASLWFPTPDPARVATPDR